MECIKCKREYKRQECEFCIREGKWNSLIKESFIHSTFPPRIETDLLCLNLPEIEMWENSYLYGVVKSGKTIEACTMLLETKHFNYIYNQEASYCFKNASDLLVEIKASYGKNVMDENQIIEKYIAYDYLVLDDLGAERVTEWALQILYIIINRRYEWEKETIITSNFSLAELAQNLGDDRIPSRIQRMCKQIKFNKPI
jgi:DNA replication protein DnaC